MANQPLTEFIALQIESEPNMGVVLTGKLGTDVARVLDDPTPVAPDAQYTNFALNTYASGASAGPIYLWRRMTFDDLKQLSTALKGQEHHLPASLDPAQLHAFMKQIAAELSDQPSPRFTQARFGDVTRDTSGAIIAHFGVGVDMVGTVHDARGAVTVEQHVVPLPPGRFRRPSKADRLSLAAALAAFIHDAPPPVNPLWEQLEQDAAGA